MKVIFLNIDGVLTNESNYQYSILDKNNVQLFNKLLEESGAIVVISSSWRLMISIAEISSRLKAAGFKYFDRLLGITPVLSSEYTCADEIYAWIKQMPIQKYVVINDDKFEDNNILTTTFGDNVIVTNPVVGLTDVKVKEALRLLQ